MKLFFLLSILFFNTLNADEVKRIETIVLEIEKLQGEYSKLDDKLVLSEYNLKDEKEKNKILTKEIKSLNNQIKDLKNILKSKESKIKKLGLKYSKNRENEQKCLRNQIKQRDGVFPQLQMKEQYRLVQNDELVYFKPSAFRLNKEAQIFDGIDGEPIETWESMRSFTSNQKTKKWVKITGYFVDKVWRPSQKELWVLESDTIRRSE